MPMEPPDWEKIALLMPTTAPRLSRSGPPELPGLIDASVWTNSSYGPLPMNRSLALTIPVVTVWSRPNGLPIAITGSPTCSRSESPRGSTARAEESIFSKARSVGGSVPTTRAACSVPRERRTTMSPPLATTWLLVTT